MSPAGSRLRLTARQLIHVFECHVGVRMFHYFGQTEYDGTTQKNCIYQGATNFPHQSYVLVNIVSFSS